MLVWLDQMEAAPSFEGLPAAPGLAAEPSTVGVATLEPVVSLYPVPTSPSAAAETHRRKDVCSTWVDPTLAVLAPVLEGRGGQVRDVLGILFEIQAATSNSIGKIIAN